MFSKWILKAGLILSLILSSSILVGCGSGKKKSTGASQVSPPVVQPPTPSADATPAPADLSGNELPAFVWEPWMKERWQDKSARLIRNGQGLSDADDRQTLSGLDNRDYVQSLMNDPKFIETILDFNLFFLGFKSDTQTNDGNSMVAAELGAKFPHAVSSAKEVQQGGDFLKLLKLQQPLYLRPLSEASLPDDDDDGDGSDNDNGDGDGGNNGQPDPVPPTQKEIRQTIYAMITTRLDALIAAISGEQTTAQDLCAALDENQFTDLFSNVGVPDDVSELLSNEWTLSPSISCFFKVDIDVPSTRLSLIRARETMSALFDLFESIDPVLYKPVALSDLKIFYPENFGLKPGTQLTQGGFWQNLQNSSTNYNRRRASYVLKRYFCDDLTPISVVAPDVHADNQHASAPACRSCHYKLDPMAGFFKDNGLLGISFQGASKLLFDDGAQIEREKYQSAWKSADPVGNPGRAWEIGYVRSTEDQALNSWGESVSDLFRIIETAPEVKHCVVRRLKDYFVGSYQAMDAGFMEYLSQKFIEESKVNSTAAMKNVITDLVTSKTFMTPDPISTACYDYAPGTDPSHRPPCHVAFVLERNCGSCHSSKASAGGLDLTGWIKLDDGSLSFPHRKGGVQQSREQTFVVMQERLVTMDKKKRMPLDMHMSAVDREALFLWVEKKLAK